MKRNIYEECPKCNKQTLDIRSESTGEGYKSIETCVECGYTGVFP